MLSIRTAFAAIGAAAALTCSVAVGACKQDDYSARLTGLEQCLLLRSYGAQTPTTLVIWLHGNVSSGGPANYHFGLARRFVEAFPDDPILSVALVRPGYPDGDGDSSSVAFLHGGRGDNFTMENIAEVAGVIQRLRDRYKPRRLIVVGHSGGAATAAVLLGARPKLVDAAVLLSCPCDLIAWRSGRQPYGRSENPIKWVDKLDPQATVVAISGSRDDNTLPDQAKAYITALQARGVASEFILVAEATHNSVVQAPEVNQTLARLLAPR